MKKLLSLLCLLLVITSCSEPVEPEPEPIPEETTTEESVTNSQE